MCTLTMPENATPAQLRAEIVALRGSRGPRRLRLRLVTVWTDADGDITEYDNEDVTLREASDRLRFGGTPEASRWPLTQHNAANTWLRWTEEPHETARGLISGEVRETSLHLRIDASRAHERAWHRVMRRWIA